MSQQLSLYAEDAEVLVVEYGTHTAAPQTLKGRSAIGGWIARMCSDSLSIRVVDHVETETELTVIAECRDSDGALGVYSSTARLHDGLLVRQHVVLL